MWYAVLMQLGEEFLNKFGLQERFAAGDGYAAAFFQYGRNRRALRPARPRRSVCRLRSARYRDCGNRRTAAGSPAYNTYVSHAGAVHRAEIMDGMNVSGHIATFLSLLNLSIRLGKRERAVPTAGGKREGQPTVFLLFELAAFPLDSLTQPETGDASKMGTAVGLLLRAFSVLPQFTDSDMLPQVGNLRRLSQGKGEKNQRMKTVGVHPSCAPARRQRSSVRFAAKNQIASWKVREITSRCCSRLSL